MTLIKNIYIVFIILFFSLIFTVSLSSAINMYPSDELQYSNDSQYSTSSTTYVTLSIIDINTDISGGFRVKYHTDGLFYSQINSSNGTSIGDEIYTTVSTDHNYILNSTITATDDILVRAKSGGGGDIYISNYRIYYSNVSYGIPVISSPTNGTTYTDVNITWNASSTYVPVYNYQIANDSAFTDLLINGTSNLTTYVFSPAAIGQYYYIRVRQLTDYWNVQSDWSDTVQIYPVDNSNPPPPEFSISNIFNVTLMQNTQTEYGVVVLPMDFRSDLVSHVLISLADNVFTSPYAKMDETGLIAHWKLDGDATDSSVNNHNGTVNDTVNWSTSIKYNTAAKILLDDGQIDVPYSEDFNLTPGDWIGYIGTHEFTAIDNFPTFITRRGESTSYLPNFYIRGGSGGYKSEVEFLYHTGSAWNIYRTDGFNLTAGERFTISLSYRMSYGNSIQFWKNDTVINGTWNTGTGNDTPVYNNEPIYLFGAGYFASGLRGNGTHDDIYLYGRELTQMDVETYNHDVKSFSVTANHNSSSANWTPSDGNIVTVPYLNDTTDRFVTVYFNDTQSYPVNISGVDVYWSNDTNTIDIDSINIGYIGNPFYVDTQLMVNNFMQQINSTGHIIPEFDLVDPYNLSTPFEWFFYAEEELVYMLGVLYSSGFNTSDAALSNINLIMEHLSNDVISNNNGGHGSGIPGVNGSGTNHMEFYMFGYTETMRRMWNYTNAENSALWNTTMQNFNVTYYNHDDVCGLTSVGDVASNWCNLMAISELNRYNLGFVPIETAGEGYLRGTNITSQWTNYVENSTNGYAETSPVPSSVYHNFATVWARSIYENQYQNASFFNAIDNAYGLTQSMLLKDGFSSVSYRSAGHNWNLGNVIALGIMDNNATWNKFADISYQKLRRYKYNNSAYGVGPYFIDQNAFNPADRSGYMHYSGWANYGLLTGVFLAISAEEYNPYAGLADIHDIYISANMSDIKQVILQDGNYSIFTNVNYANISIGHIAATEYENDLWNNGTQVIPFRYIATVYNASYPVIAINPSDYRNDAKYDMIRFKYAGAYKYFNSSSSWNNSSSLVDLSAHSIVTNYSSIDYDGGGINSINTSASISGDNVHILLSVDFNTTLYDFIYVPIDIMLDDNISQAVYNINNNILNYSRSTETMNITNVSVTNGSNLAMVDRTTTDYGFTAFGKSGHIALEANMTNSPFVLEYDMKISTTNQDISILSVYQMPTIVSAPTNLSNTTGANWINWTWDDGSNYTYAEVWINEVLNTTVTNETFNMTYAAHSNNISVRGYNVTAGTHSSWANDTVTLVNNVPVISNVSATYERIIGQNLYIDADCTDSDLDTCTFSTNRSDLFIDFNTATGQGNWTTIEGTYSIDFGVVDGYGGIDNMTTIVTVSPSTYTPPIIVIDSVTTGNFWKNITYSAGVGNVTDAYNVSRNGTWYNGTDAFLNSTTTAHSWINDTIYAWNNSNGGVLSAGVTNDTQIPNNIISISGISSTYNINEGDTLNIDANYSDADGDTGTFADNATEWDINTGTGVVVWITSDSDQGTYYYQINVSDGYGSTAAYNFTVNVADSTPVITQYCNDINGCNQTALSLNAGNTVIFNVTISQTANISWYVGAGEEQNTTSPTFSRNFPSTGTFNVTATGYNANGTSSTVHTVVTVVSGGGGGGTNWDVLDGYVKYTNGTGIVNATVWTTKGSRTTSVTGYYSYGYLFEDGQTYWINVSKTGFDNNNSQLTFDEDHEVFNVTLLVTSVFSGTVNNLTATPDTDLVHLNWTATPNADKYSVYELEEGIPWFDTQPTLDGIIDDIYLELSHHFHINSPNPVNTNDFDVLYMGRDATWVYLSGTAIDNDAHTTDDYARLYTDFNKNGLTTDDLMYEIKENGATIRYVWSGSAWVPSGGSGVTGTTTGAGTNLITYELRVPVSELPANWINGTNVSMMLERECTSLNPDVYAYYPFGNINATDTSLWQDIKLTNTSEYEFLSNTTNNFYNATGLIPYNWYRFAVSAWNGSQETSYSLVNVTTLDTPSYNISGYIIDNVTGLGIPNAQVWATNGFTSARETTNATGYYFHGHFHNGTYIIYANADGYDQNNTTSFVVAGANITNNNVTLTPTPPLVAYGLSRMPYQIYMMLISIVILLVYFTFTVSDPEYYTDIITALFAMLISAIVAHNSIMGVLIMYPLQTEVQYDIYASAPLGIVFALVSLLMLLIFVTKILDLGHRETDSL